MKKSEANKIYKVLAGSNPSLAETFKHEVCGGNIPSTTIKLLNSISLKTKAAKIDDVVQELTEELNNGIEVSNKNRILKISKLLDDSLKNLNNEIVILQQSNEFVKGMCKKI